MSRPIDKQCSICTSREFLVCERETHFKKLDRVPDQFIVKCSGCGIVTRSPSLFSPDFDSNLVVDVRRDEHFIGGDSDNVARYLQERLQKAEEEVEGRSLLDVGCGSGAFLIHAKQRGWTSFGTEARPSAADEMALHGIKVFIGDLDNSNLREMKFDFIHMNHVLEHVSDPVAVLSSIRSLLSEGGIAIVEVPNEFDAFTQRLRQAMNLDGSSVTTYFQHEWFFAPRTLRLVCEKSGLRVRRLHTPFRTSDSLLKEPMRLAGAFVGAGEVIEAVLEI